MYLASSAAKKVQIDENINIIGNLHKHVACNVDIKAL